MKTLIAALVLSFAASVAAAQNPPATPVPSGPPTAVPPLAGQPPSAPRIPLRAAPHTIRFDLTITDSGGGRPAASKTLSVTMAEGRPTVGSIRSTAPVIGVNEPTRYNVDKEGRPQPLPPATLMLPLNFDVRDPQLFENQSVGANVSVEYQPYVPDAKVPPTTIRAGSTSVFENGKKTLLLQAADPITDRRTTIEVTATVLK